MDSNIRLILALISGVLLIKVVVCVEDTLIHNHSTSPESKGSEQSATDTANSFEVISPDSGHDSGNKIQLKKCQTNTLDTWNYFNGTKILLPTIILENLSYSRKTFIIDEHPLHLCEDTNESPINTTVSVTINQFVSLQAPEVEDQDEEGLEEEGVPIGNLFSRFTVLLSNGVLSVGQHDSHYLHFNPNEYCIEAVHSITGDIKDATIRFRTCPITKDRPVISKCCPPGLLLSKELGCEYNPKGVERHDLEILDAKTLKPASTKTNPTFRTDFQCNSESHVIHSGCNSRFYPLTDNTAAVLGPYERKLERFGNNHSFCFDRQISGDDLIDVLMYCEGEKGHKLLILENAQKARISIYYTLFMYIGAFFHLLTSAVYLITWKKQNIHGRTLCSLTIALCLMDTLMGTNHLIGSLKDDHESKVETFCFLNGIGAHYFHIASFTWVLVVNIDLWITFRSIRADGNNSLSRFIKYSLLGWGFPFLFVLVCIILNQVYQCASSMVPIPGYGMNYYCYVTPSTQGYYVYCVLTLLIGLSWVLATATLFSLCSAKKAATNLRSSKRQNEKETAILFLKLSVVMGFTWIFEVISWAVTNEEETNHSVWIVFDFYNAISAVLIFIIFVCKKTSLDLLDQTHPMFKGATAAIRKLSSSLSRENYSTNTNGSK